MYAVYYGTTGAQGAICGQGTTIAAAQQNAVRMHNDTLDAAEHVQSFAQLVALLGQTDMVVLVVRMQQ